MQEMMGKNTFWGKASTSIFFLIWFSVVAYYCYSILYEANWIFSDDHVFWDATAIGQFFFASDINTALLRFFPLGKVDFNILLFFFDTPTAYSHYVWITITFILFAFFYAKILLCIEQDNTFSYSKYLLPVFFIAIFFVKDFMYLYMRVIYPERMLILMLSLFLCFYYNALKTDRILYYIAAMPCVAYATYLKEPVFAAFLVIVLFTSIFHYKNLSKKHKIFNAFLVVNALVFLALFYVAVYSGFQGTSYATSVSRVDVFEALYRVLIGEKVLLVACALGVIRLYFLFFKKNQYQYIFYDATLYTAIAYICAFILLKLVWRYYYVPAVLLAFPSFFYWTLKSFTVSKKLPYILSAIVLLIPIIYCGDQVRLLRAHHAERVQCMPHIEKLADLYSQGYRFIYVEQEINRPEFFYEKFNRTWQKTVFADALNYVLGANNAEDTYYTVKNILRPTDIDEKTLVLYSSSNNVERPMHSTTQQTLETYFAPPEHLIGSKFQIYSLLRN